MAADKKQKPSNSIPIHFADSDETPVLEEDLTPEDLEAELVALDPDEFEVAPAADSGEGMGGPQLAELIASRAELKRLQSALAEATDTAARRHADFDNYRKRVERDRGETHNRIVADVARKLLPVLDNLSRALDAERTIEAEESKEFRHFLHGVELINKQLNDVLESLGFSRLRRSASVLIRMYTKPWLLSLRTNLSLIQYPKKLPAAIALVTVCFVRQWLRWPRGRVTTSFLNDNGKDNWN
jgi:molecular chaperone GrpE (heat shock protein)